MSTLYIDRKDTRLKREGKTIVVYQAGERQSTVPVSLLERVVMRGTVVLDTGLLGLLAESGVGVLALSGRQGRQMAIMLGRPHADAERRVAQYALCRNDDWCREWTRRIVRHKVVSQLRLIRRAAARRPDRRLELRKAASALQRFTSELREPNTTLTTDRVRGVEGAAAAAYFAAYTSLFAESLEFRGRNRRPPRDPVNAVLSLGYTLLHFDAVQAIHRAGLDPLVGFFHELSYGRESLAADLIEPFRSRVDRWVWERFRKKHLRVEQFTREGAACYLAKSARSAFYGGWEVFAKPLRRVLLRVARKVATEVVASYRDTVL